MAKIDSSVKNDVVDNMHCMAEERQQGAVKLYPTGTNSHFQLIQSM